MRKATARGCKEVKRRHYQADKGKKRTMQKIVLGVDKVRG
jgi:hypothetical protein